MIVPIRGRIMMLSIKLPEWYFGTLLQPFSGGLLTMIPAIGAVCMVVGVYLAVVQRRARLLPFAVSVLLSQILMAGASGQRLPSDEARLVLQGFLAAQLAVAIFVFWWSGRPRLAPVLLLVFTSTYALFAAALASMSFSDSWL